MKNYTLGIFATPELADDAVSRIHNDLSIPTEQISYIYKDAHGAMKSGDANSNAAAPAHGAVTGATIGGVVGAGLGLATVAGLIPVIGPIFAAGPLLAALGMGAGAAATTAAGALTGAAAGGIVGALVNLGIEESAAKVYEEKIVAGNVLVAVHADDAIDIASVLREAGAMDINSYQLK